MRRWIKKKLQNMTREDVFVFTLGVSFLVGVWYALPMVNTITDVWAFGGGVLRAIEAHTLLPGSDVAYGTLSFYQNYIVMVIVLFFGLFVTGFDIEALKTIFILNPSYSLIVPRIVSALTAMVLLAVVYRFLKVHVDSLWWRLALLILIFGNVLTVLLTRSGKMWILSIALVVVSFIYLYRAITEERRSGVSGRMSTISIVTVFLATANFPMAGVFFINIPILLFTFRGNIQSLWRIVRATLIGLVVLVGVFLLNASNIIEQVSGFVLQFFGLLTGGAVGTPGELSPFESFLVNAQQTVEAFPLLLLALIPALYAGIRDKTLAYLSLIYGAVYIVAVSFIFTSDHGIALNVRHIFPLGFFLLFLVVAYRTPVRRVAVGFFSIGLLAYVYILFLISVPTTYNVASKFITQQYGTADIRIDEHIFELTLPMNKASYELFIEESCGSTCQHRKMLDTDIAFRPLVVTEATDPDKLPALSPPDVLVVERAIVGCPPIARFGNGTPDDEVFDIDINLGRMLLPSFYQLNRLGKNIYVYETAHCGVQ